MNDIREDLWKIALLTVFSKDQRTRILDFGCGTGGFLQLVREFHLAGEGIDSDPVSVTRAKSTGLDVVKGDRNSLARRKKQYNVITAWNLNGQPRELSITIKALLEKLASGAVLIISLDTESADTDFKDIDSGFSYDVLKLQSIGKSVLFFYSGGYPEVADRLRVVTDEDAPVNKVIATGVSPAACCYRISAQNYASALELLNCSESAFEPQTLDWLKLICHWSLGDLESVEKGLERNLNGPVSDFIGANILPRVYRALYFDERSIRLETEKTLQKLEREHFKLREIHERFIRSRGYKLIQLYKKIFREQIFGTLKRLLVFLLSKLLRFFFAGSLHKREQFEILRRVSGKAQAFLIVKDRITQGFEMDLSGVSYGGNPENVSVVIPVYNQAELLRYSVESLFRQSYENYEIIVVDDGSTDTLAEVIRPFESDARFRVIHQSNQKLPRALSTGFHAAMGEYFTWTSADNVMEPDCLLEMVSFLKSHRDAEMVYCNYNIIDENGGPFINHPWFCPGYQTPAGSHRIHLPRDISELNVIRNNYIGCCFMHRGWVGKLLGEYQDGFHSIEDYDYWMRLNALFRICHMGRDRELYNYRLHDDSLTANTGKLMIVEKSDALIALDARRQQYFLAPFQVYLSGAWDRMEETIQPFISKYPAHFESGTNGFSRENDAKPLVLLSGTAVPESTRRWLRERDPGEGFAVVYLSAGDLDQPGCADIISSVDFRILNHEADRTAFQEQFSGELFFSAPSAKILAYPVTAAANIRLFTVNFKDTIQDIIDL